MRPALFRPLRLLRRLLPWFLAAPTVLAAELVATNGTWRHFKGRAEPSTPDRTAWRQPGFSDAAWGAAPAPFSYGRGTSAGTVLSDMPGGYSTLYLRTRFSLPNTNGVTRLVLRAVVDDGFIAWLNGREVARFNVGPGDRPFNDHEAADRQTESLPDPQPFRDFPLADPSVLRPGENVLAVQLINSALYSSDALFDAALSAEIRETDPPRILAVDPAPGPVTGLTRLTVQFSEPVTGVDASDFLLNGASATNLVVLDPSRYEFQFPLPPVGAVQASWVPDHGIVDRAATPNRFVSTASGNTWEYTLSDGRDPVLDLRLPPPGSVVSQLAQVEVRFSEPVEGVDAADLLVGGQPASSVTGVGAGPYTFTFPARPAGLVEIRFRAGHGITDLDQPARAFAGAAWSATVDPQHRPPAVRINEFLAASVTGLRDEDGEAQSWIELVNQGPTSVDLGGFALTDDPDDPGAWTFPPLVLGAGQHLVVFASGKDRRTVAAGRRLHTHFKLSRQGEFLGLFDTSSPRRVVDALEAEYPEQRNDVSYGRDAGGAWRYFSIPTPGLPNSGPLLGGACEPVRFSVERGYFAHPFELVLSCATPGAAIRYTTNGSEPVLTSGVPYTAPIPMSRTLPIRAAAFRTNLLPSRVVTHTYLFGTSAGTRSVPALSLVTAPDNLTGTNGIVGMQGGTRDASGAWNPVRSTDYYNPLKRGRAWERPASLEWIDAADNGGFQADAGLRLHASDYFRPRLTPTSKFSWRLYFRGDYGAGRLEHPILPPGVGTTAEFDALVLRAGSNDQNPFVKDELVRRLFADCGQVSARGTLGALYVNGRYAGYYNPVERIEGDFLALQHGGTPAWDVMSQSGPVDGDRVDFDRFLTFLRGNDPAQEAVYQRAQRWIDVTNYIDYLLVNAYGYNGDWPHNNWRAGRERRDGALWRFYVWDAEWSFGTYGRAVTGNTFSELGGTDPISTIFQRLRRSAEFRRLFADRAHRHLFNGGALSEANVRRRFGELQAAGSRIISGMDRTITNSWVTSRPRSLLAHLDGIGCLASSNAPVLRRHGGVVPAGFALTLTNLGGTIFYTTNGLDPRVPFTGAVSAGALAYDAARPPVLSAGLTLRARSLAGTNWSALTEASFQVGELTLPLRLTEVMYNPPGGEAFEFVELRNLSGRDIDVGSFSFSGIQFTFPTLARMPAGAVWVLASDRNPAQFRQRYPGVSPAGWFGGSLANGGERLDLLDARGSLVDRVEYSDARGWPTAADGGGRSLVRRDPLGDGTVPDDWAASGDPGGSPGTIEAPVPPAGPVFLAEVFPSGPGSRPGEGGDYVELGSRSPTPVPLAGWRLYRADRTNRFVFPPEASLTADQRLTVWCETGPAGSLRTDFSLPREGTTVVLENPDGLAVSVVTYGPVPDGWALHFGDDDGRLGLPSPGSAAVEPAPLAPAGNLALNEWLPNPPPGADDFVELFNRDPERPVSLTGLAVARDGEVHEFRLPAFVGPRQAIRWRATGDSGPEQLRFRLPATGAVLRLLDASGAALETVTYTNAPEGTAYGRFPDGTTNLLALAWAATPGELNALPAPGPLRFHEILAVPAPGPARDWIELRHHGTNTLDAAGWGIVLSGRPERRWALPGPLPLIPGRLLVVAADSGRPASTQPGPELNMGWALPDEGGELLLTDPAGRVVDRVRYGAQIPGLSIGAQPSGEWTLLSGPTPAGTNREPAALGVPEAARINEWLASATGEPDFVELFNPTRLPIPLGGERLTDDPSLAGINRFILAPLTYLAPQSWLLFLADGDPERGPQHLPFRLDSAGETLRLASASGFPYDSVTVLPGPSGEGGGRLPDGEGSLRLLAVSTPGRSNLADTDLDGDGMSDGWEMLHGFNPRDARDAGLDADGDGAGNRAEFLAGTDPRRAESVLALRYQRSIAGLALTFPAEPGRSYTVLVSTNFPGTGWTRLFDVDPVAVPGPVEFLVSPGEAPEVKLYRVTTPRVP